LVARVKIASYNRSAAADSAPFFQALVLYSYQVYSGEAADNVIQSVWKESGPERACGHNVQKNSQIATGSCGRAADAAEKGDRKRKTRPESGRVLG